MSASAAEAPVVWLASYPKSGNTWLRFLLAHLLGGLIEHSAQLQARVPDAHKITDWRLLRRDRINYLKTHWACERIALPHDCRATVQIVRNPWDVLAASFNFYLLTSASAVADDPAALARVRKDYVERFIEHRGDLRWLPLGAGSWSENVRSWQRAAHPTLLIRYEDLSADPRREVGRLVDFLALEAGPAVIAASSFAALRRLEEREIALRRAGLFWRESYGAGHARGHRFVNRGEVRCGGTLLTAEERARIATTFADEIARLGYETLAVQPD